MFWTGEDDVIRTVSDELFEEYEVRGVPYAVLLDAGFAVVAKGGINTVAELESLLGLDVFVRRTNGPDLPVKAVGGPESSKLEQQHE